MKEVTKAEFWAILSNKNVKLSSDGKKLSTTIFKLDGKIVGKITEAFTDNQFNHYPLVSSYFLNC